MGIYKEKREYTKNDLLDSFWKIYESKNINQITVKEITDKAGYNRGTFYIHFKDVTDVLQCIEERLFEEYNELHKNIDSYKFINSEFLINAINLFVKNEQYYRVLLSPKGDPYFVEKCKEKLKKSLIFYINKDSIIIENDKDIVMEYLASGIISSISCWFETRPFSEVELLHILTTLLEAFLKQFDLTFVENKI